MPEGNVGAVVVGGVVGGGGGGVVVVVVVVVVDVVVVLVVVVVVLVLVVVVVVEAFVASLGCCAVEHAAVMSAKLATIPEVTTLRRFIREKGPGSSRSAVSVST